VGVLILAMAAAAAQPAEPADDAGKSDSEIVVTGERVKRSLKDTPSSVAVFDKRGLERLAAADRIGQILERIPNVLVVTNRDAPIIRGQAAIGVLQGLPAFLGGARPRTVMQIDGRTVTFNEFVNSTTGLWDVDHVEVFRSPQTTTQGVNSIGGAIFIHTAEPTYALSGRAQLIGGTWTRRQASAAVSVPVVSDQLAFRVSGDFYRSHTSTTMEGPVVGVDNLNLDRYWTTRAKLLAEPRGVPGLRILTTYAHTYAQAPQGELAQPPLRERHDPFYIFGYFKSGVDSVTSQITYPLGDALESRTTLSWGKSHFRRFAPQGFGQTRIHARDGSAETVIEWKPERAVSAVGGVSFQEVNINQAIDLSNADLGTGSFKDRQVSFGVFGDVAWHPVERVTLTAGARYQSDGKRRTGLLHTTPELPLDYDKTNHAFLPKVSASYNLTKEVRAGVLVQRAYNPGGTTLDPAHHAQLNFPPEYLWDYEGFVRGDLFAGRGSINANVFYNDVHNAQRELDFDINSPGGHVGLLQIISEPRGRTYGAELELRAKISQRLTLEGSVGLLRTRITKGIAPGDPFLDKEFYGSPHFTAAAVVEWEPVRKLHVSAQAHHTSGFWGDDNNDPQFRTKAWTMVDGRVSWDTSHFTLFGYAQNLFNTFRVLGYSGPEDAPGVEVGLTDPREIGVGLQARF
jgi:outer membrane receptor protein involved in Fe transport